MVTNEAEKPPHPHRWAVHNPPRPQSDLRRERASSSSLRVWHRAARRARSVLPRTAAVGGVIAGMRGGCNAGVVEGENPRVILTPPATLHLTAHPHPLPIHHAVNDTMSRGASPQLSGTLWLKPCGPGLFGRALVA